MHRDDVVNKQFITKQIISYNTIISDNLNKLFEKLNKIHLNIIEGDDDEYENFYNRINFYFTNIVTQLKLIFVENYKTFQLNESEMLNKINVNKNI